VCSFSLGANAKFEKKAGAQEGAHESAVDVTENKFRSRVGGFVTRRICEKKR
jgi:hypothetical protein